MSKKIIKFPEVEVFFKDFDFTDDHIELSVCEVITDIEVFVESHLQIIRSNQGKSVAKRKTIMPYWNRLLTVYKMCNLNWDK